MDSYRSAPKTLMPSHLAWKANATTELTLSDRLSLDEPTPWSVTRFTSAEINRVRTIDLSGTLFWKPYCLADNLRN